MITLYVSNDNTVFWDAMERSSDGAFISDATVTFTLKNSAGSSITGATGLSMAYVSGSNGKYIGYIPYTASLVVGTGYTIEVTATASGRQGFRVLDAQVLNRTT